MRLGKVVIQDGMGGNDEREQTLNQLLTEMDGFDADKGVVILLLPIDLKHLIKHCLDQEDLIAGSQ